MGPTVNSLEVALHGTPSGLAATLFHVMRHPHLPKITRLGTVNDVDQIPPLIKTVLGQRNPESSILGSGPEWMDIWTHEDAILAGLRTFAEADHDTDWRTKADELIAYALMPWGRVSPREASNGTVFDDDADPIDCWLAAITDDAVIVGQKLFMRSAWEGALAYRKSQWDDNAAQRAADSARNGAHERLDAELASRH